MRISPIAILPVLTLLVGCAFVTDEGLDAESDTASITVSSTDFIANFFDRDGVGWASQRDLTESEFSSEVGARRNDGEILVDVDIDIKSGSERFSGVWRKNEEGRDYRVHWDLTSAGFGERSQSLRSQGSILVDQESYEISGNPRYAGLWVENLEGVNWGAFRNYTSANYAGKSNDYRSLDYIPIDFEGYKINGNTLYSGIFIKNTHDYSWVTHHSLSESSYANFVTNLAAGGFRVFDFESYKGSGQRYGAIWHEKENGRSFVAIRDMSENQLGDHLRKYTDRGYRIVDFEVYKPSLSRKYAAVWLSNTSRPGWQYRSAVTDVAEAAMDDFDVPGMAVAVIKDGDFKYLRGFGRSGGPNARPVHSGTVFRLGSVSKAVAGVLGLDLWERGLIELNWPTRLYVPSMPLHHTHTVAQTLTNRSGIGNYGEHGQPGPFAHFETAESALGFFENDPLPNAVGAYDYSTHAYTAAGAAFEAAIGGRLYDVVINEMTERYGLRTLRPENLAVDADRTGLMHRIAGANVESPTRDNLSWKILGGGMESSVADLARFGDKVLRGRILGPGMRDNFLWTSLGGRDNYGYGWEVRGSGCLQMAEKGGTQLGANAGIRVLRTLGYTIVVLTNRMNGGHDGEVIAMRIGNVFTAAECP